MRKSVVLNMTLSLVGLGSLLVYVLACTSFSPDDSKVLYLTMDAKSGMTAVAVYDRKAAKSEVLFEPFALNTNLEAEPALLRPQWLEGGHDFLATWLVVGDNSQQPVNVAVLPFDRRGPARTFTLPNAGKDGPTWFYFWPVPVVGKNFFWNGEFNTMTRLDLETGEMRRWTNQDVLVLLSSPDNDRLFYLGGVDLSGGSGSKGLNEVGLFNPDTFARTPLFQIKDTNVSAVSLALSRDAKKLAYQADNEAPPVVHLLETGKPARTLSLASLGEKTEVMLRHFSPKGDILYGAFRDSTDANHTDYGFVEIPLNGSAIRKTTLIKDSAGGNKDMFLSFQIDISHDGKTLAVESFWLATGDHPIKAEDCALFLADLNDPQRKVTKVPIPLPPKDRPSPFK
jgi:hypothetical protein